MKPSTWFAYTDYPIFGLDIPHQRAPIRRVRVLSYDGNKYCWVKWHGFLFEVKYGYIFDKPGRAGQVPCWGHKQLSTVERRTHRTQSVPSDKEIDASTRLARRLTRGLHYRWESYHNMFQRVVNGP